MAEIIELEDMAGLMVKCQCGNLTWHLFTDDTDQKKTLISAVRCTECGGLVRVQGGTANEK